MNLSGFGIPGSGAASSAKYIPGQGAFAIPSGVQRIAEQGLWSTFRFPAAVAITGTQPRFYSVQLGAVGQGFAQALSFSETNQQVANQAPGDETYEISSLAAEVYGATATAPLVGDLRLFQRLGAFRWEFGSVYIDVAPLSMVGAGGGIFGATADTGTPVTFVNNGPGSLWMYQSVVISVPSTQRFAMILVFGTGGQAAALAPVADTQVRVTMFNLARSAVPVA